MLCYKDKSFCIQECDNLTCDRNYTDEERQKAIAWHGDEDVPVMFSDFKNESCGFVEVTK